MPLNIEHDSKNISKQPYILTINKIKNNNTINNTDYDVLKSKKDFSPLSGSELEYNPKLWNNNSNIKNSHNCYSYALGNIVKGIKSKAQPGYSSGYEHIDDKDYQCNVFYERLKHDSPATYKETFDNKCIPGFYKIFLALDKQMDYHWYRQDSNKLWSHKPGYSDVVNYDADNKKIKNPALASRDYSYLNYKTPCFYACINSDLSRSLDSIYNTLHT